MNVYEFTFLLNEEAELPNLKKLIEAASGKVTAEQKWAKRDLAYPIKKLTNATYYIWKIELEAKNLPDLNRKLNFNDKLIRYLLLTVDKS